MTRKIYLRDKEQMIEISPGEYANVKSNNKHS
jgi:hypothetical protein